MHITVMASLACWGRQRPGHRAQRWDMASCNDQMLILRPMVKLLVRSSGTLLPAFSLWAGSGHPALRSDPRTCIALKSQASVSMWTFHKDLRLCAEPWVGVGTSGVRMSPRKPDMLLSGMLPSPTDFSSSGVIQGKLVLTHRVPPDKVEPQPHLA